MTEPDTTELNIPPGFSVDTTEIHGWGTIYTLVCNATGISADVRGKPTQASIDAMVSAIAKHAEAQADAG